MISNKKYVNASKMEQPIIKSVGFNNEDVLITENGEYHAKSPYTGFGKVIVDVPTSTETPIGWIPKNVFDNGVWMSPVLPNLTGLTVIYDYALAYAYYRNTYAPMTIDFSNIRQITVGGLLHTFDSAGVLGEVNLSGLVSVNTESLAYAFWDTGITSIDISNLVNVPDAELSDKGSFSNAFYGCKSLSSVNISSLKNVGRNAFSNAFSNCSSLETIDVSKIERIGYSGFYRAFYSSGIRGQLVFNNLNYIDGNALSNCFCYCYYLTDISFPSLTTQSFGSSYVTQFAGMLNGVRNCTLHFPSNLSNTISRLSGYPTFGGTGTVILYDLPATE